MKKLLSIYINGIFLKRCTHDITGVKDEYYLMSYEKFSQTHRAFCSINSITDENFKVSFGS